jgi:hypothetical protein
MALSLLSKRYLVSALEPFFVEVPFQILASWLYRPLDRRAIINIHML